MLTLAAVLVIGILRPTPCEAARKSTPNAEGSGGQDSKAPPHLVVVVGDDFGTYDGASYRGGKIHTPVLDGLVKHGNIRCMPSPFPTFHSVCRLKGYPPLRYLSAARVVVLRQHMDHHYDSPL